MKVSIPFLLFAFLLVAACSDNPTDRNKESPLDIPEEYECRQGLADNRYECDGINLVARLGPEDLLADPQNNGNALNDIWGWTDPQTGIEYALVGLVDGVAFVDLSNPVEPKVVGKLGETESVSEKSAKVGAGGSLAHDEKSTWRDLKTYENYLYVVSDGQPHGMQVFDLTRLRNIDSSPEMFSEDYLYDGIENAHNIAINEETGYGYIVGSDTYGGGLHIIDLENPLAPTFAGFHSDGSVGFNSTGYVHDTQCVVYKGPDSDYQGDEICMNSSETHLVIANVTDKENTGTIAKATYENNSYAHQGWFTEDHQYFLLDDEFDEASHELPTQTYIWDVRDLDNPRVVGVFESSANSTDHNQFVKNNFVYQSNYTSGLRILSLDNIGNGSLEEVRYFDTHPESNRTSFEGAWSNYPYFEGGLVIVSDITNGLFILDPVELEF